MPDHYREILQHAPLAAFGMVIGQADLLLQQTPMIVKAVTIAALSVGAYYDIKTDLKVMQTEMTHASVERQEFRAFMVKGDRCTSIDCGEMKSRIRALEAMRMNGK